MSRCYIGLLCVVATVTALGLGAVAWEGSDPPTKEEKEKKEARRKELWAELNKAKPKDITIVASCENPALTVICFSSDSGNYFFDLKSKKLTRVIVMKTLPPIGRIEYHVNEDGYPSWLLYSGDSLEMTLPADR